MCDDRFNEVGGGLFSGLVGCHLAADALPTAHIACQVAYWIPFTLLVLAKDDVLIKLRPVGRIELTRTGSRRGEPATETAHRTSAMDECGAP